ncbi:MAG TPA: PEGA domain-containing protein [Chthoniobacteraceae bacterium]|nr:PEGA domain-containing protein [Chthoniobacteraceae bacterium]
MSDRPGNSGGIPAKIPVSENLSSPIPAPPMATPAVSRAVKGSVVIQTEPSGAMIECDGSPAGRSPFVLDGLAMGEHSLELVLEGYEDCHTALIVTRAEPVMLKKISLERFHGWLKVATQPDTASISVSGPADADLTKRIGNPWTSDKLPIGEYKITAFPPGWHPLTKTVAVKRDELTTVVFDLAPGAVQFTSVPSDASVYQGGRLLGKTPLLLSNVEPGNRSYTLRLESYDDRLTEVEVEPGRMCTLDVALVKTVAKPPSIHRPVARPDVGDRPLRGWDGPPFRFIR